MVDGSFVFAAGGVGIEVTKSVGLESVGDDPKQEIAGEMLRGGLAKCVPPTNPQLLQMRSRKRAISSSIEAQAYHC